MFIGLVARMLLNFSTKVLHQGLVSSNCLYTGSVFQVISGWICVKSVLQVIFDMQGVSFNNLLLDMVHSERISQGGFLEELQHPKRAILVEERLLS